MGGAPTPKPSTRLLHTGRPPSGWVNTPVTRGSTFVFNTVAEWRNARQRRETERVLSYGARGTDSTHALEDALVELEGGYGARLFPTGQAAIAVMLQAYLSAGDHVLLTDAVYEPVRKFCQRHLARMGVETTLYKPDGSDLESRLQRNTKLIYVESPGSLTYEMVDLPAIAAWAHSHDCLVAADNTWGSGLLYNPLALGADISVLAATKYLGGHADVVMGAVVTTKSAWKAMEEAAVSFGQTVGADDAFLVLRGIRSLPLRLEAHARNSMRIAHWLQQRPEVERVLCPALPGDPSHALWQRDCRGMNGLLSVKWRSGIRAQDVERMIDNLHLFGIGASWGGFESLAIPFTLDANRSVTPASGNAMLRLHIGLEDVDDLIADLEQGLSFLGER